MEMLPLFQKSMNLLPASCTASTPAVTTTATITAIDIMRLLKREKIRYGSFRIVTGPGRRLSSSLEHVRYEG